MVLPARGAAADCGDRLSGGGAAFGVDEVGTARRCLRSTVAGPRPDRTACRPARPSTAGHPLASHLAAIALSRGGGVVGRRTRGPPCRPGVLPPVVRRCTPLGCVRDRAGLDAPLLVRCTSPARRTGPGRRVAARARCAGRRARRRADLVHGHAGGHRARGHARARRRGADQRRLPVRRGPRAAVDVVPDRQPPRRPARVARVQGLLLLSPPGPKGPTRSTATNTPSSKHCWRACRPDRSASATGSGARTAR